MICWLHELSLIRDIIARLEDIAAENNARRIRGIRLRFGALTHTPPELFKEQLRMMVKDNELFYGMEIDVEVMDDIDDNAQDIILESVDLEEGDGMGAGEEQDRQR